MAKTEGSTKSAKRKIEEVEDDTNDGKQNSNKRFFKAPKEGKRRLRCFALAFFSFTSVQIRAYSLVIGFPRVGTLQIVHFKVL